MGFLRERPDSYREIR